MKRLVREKWSRIGFIFVSVGSAIGLGNIWRFPYIVGAAGGGAFLIAYLIAITFVVPLMLLGFAAGRKFKGSLVTTFKKINPKAKYFGWFVVLVEFFILSYYIVITGWTLGFFVFSTIGTEMSLDLFIHSIYPIIFYIVAIFIITMILRSGIKRGIERVCEILMPSLFILLVILLVNSIFLPGFSEGIKFYLTPNLGELLNPSVWMLAFGQAIFSLSIGCGILLTYGSYLSKKQNIPRSSFIIIVADTLIALVAGFIIFPIIFSFGIAPEAGPKLAFVSLLSAFNAMPLGSVFAMMFFLTLFFAAMTSAISMLEVTVTSFKDEFKFGLKKSTYLASFLLLLIGLPSCLSYSIFSFEIFGKPFLDVMDYLFGSLLLPLSAVLICVVTGWLWKDSLKEIMKNSKLNLKPYMKLRYIIPVLLITLFIANLIG